MAPLPPNHPRPFVCPICGKRYALLSILRQHFTLAHRNMARCPCCGKKLSPKKISHHFSTLALEGGDICHLAIGIMAVGNVKNWFNRMYGREAGQVMAEILESAFRALHGQLVLLPQSSKSPDKNA